MEIGLKKLRKLSAGKDGRKILLQRNSRAGTITFSVTSDCVIDRVEVSNG